MRRREFIAGLGGAAAAWPLATRAQQPDRVRRIGVLMGNAEGDAEGESGVTAFRDELRKAGWTERRNVDIETRRAAMSVESMRRLAKELVGLQPDLILTSSTPAAGAMLQQTRTIPIVFVLVADPVGSGAFCHATSKPAQKTAESPRPARIPARRAPMKSVFEARIRKARCFDVGKNKNKGRWLRCSGPLEFAHATLSQ